MSLKIRMEYQKILRERYWKAKGRKEKARILDEYCSNTGQSRKYAIRRLRAGLQGSKRGRKRKWTYDGEVIAALAKLWEIFDYPCGQRLKPLLEAEVERLRGFGELEISDEVAEKLKQISPATIDRKLRPYREALRYQGRKGSRRRSWLRQRIPVKLTEWDTSKQGYLEIDLVAHCGSSTRGEYINTLSILEISSGWWEGEAILGRSQRATFEALKRIRERSPFEWKGIDSDNGPEFINDLLYRYCCREGLDFTRSRPYHRNDNAYIEEKNYTHVRKTLGYLRYDTPGELVIMNELYRGALRLYKNFFQPVMKLMYKERIGGHVRRRYDKPRTPYQRLLESEGLKAREKERLRKLYEGLNPARLKQEIEARVEELMKAYEQKKRIQHAEPNKKQKPRVTCLMS
jgi:hypothetical protein